MHFCRGLRFLSLFSFKLWWMKERMGSYGKAVPFETQFLLVEGSKGSPLSTGVGDGIGEPTIYIVFLPLLEGSFRAFFKEMKTMSSKSLWKMVRIVEIMNGINFLYLIHVRLNITLTVNSQDKISLFYFLLNLLHIWHSRRSCC